MPLATLSIDLEARLANLQAGFDKATRLAEKNASEIEARYNRIASAAAGFAAAAAASLSVAGLVQFFRATVDGLDRLNDLKDATGASIENLSALEDIALRTGTSVDSMGAALVKFNAELGKAEKGSETAKILQQIGLSAEDLRRLDPAEALRRTAVELSKFADDGNKARVVQALFGKSVQEVAPFLKDLAEAGRLNATVTTAQAQAAEDFNKQLAAFSKNATDATRALTGPVLSALNDFAKEAENARKSYRGFLEYLFDNTGPQVSGTLNERLSETARRIGQIRETIDNADAGRTKPLFADQRRALLEEQAFLERRERFLRLQQRDQGGGRGNIVPGLPGADATRPTVGDLPGSKNSGAKTTKPFDFAIEPATLEALKALETTDTARLRQLRESLDVLFERRASGIGSDPELEAGIQKLRDEISKLDPVQVAAAAAKKRLDDLLEGTPSGRKAKILGQLEEARLAAESGKISFEQFAEIAQELTPQLSAGATKAIDEMSAAAKQFQANVQDLLGDSIFQALSGNFDNIEEAWKNMLLGMASQAVAADLAGRLFGDKASGGSNAGWLAALASLFGFAKGGVFAQGQPVTAFADGGVLTRPTFFGMGGGRMGVAGEAGAEAVLPLRRGRDGSLGVETTGGSGGLVINVAAGVSRGEVVSAIQLAIQTAEGNVMQRLRALRVI